MWKLVIISFVSMTLSDAAFALRDLLLAAQLNSLLFKVRDRWEYRKHDLAFTMDGIADIFSIFATIGSGFSVLTVTGKGAIDFHFSIWSALSLLGILVGSQLGGAIGDWASVKVAGVKTTELQAQILAKAALDRRGTFG